MKLSSYFNELSSTYAYEIEDLRYDSGGDDVLKSRLKIKRDQFTELMKMSSSFPVMVVPAFHQGFHFDDTDLLNQLVAEKPEDFPAWADVAETLKMEPWAEKLAERALKEPGGEEFMLIAAGLEYIYDKLGASAAAGSGGEDSSDEEEQDEDDVDLGEAGEDFLDEQGFDRRS
jgi:hypothetical protein